MKILHYHNDTGIHASSQVGLIADSALLFSGRPFFVPEWADAFVAAPAVAVRIGRLGKCIAPKFALRYVDGIAACACVSSRGGQAGDARFESFDGALMLGGFVAPGQLGCPLGEAQVVASLAGQMMMPTSLDIANVDIEQVVSELSQYFTFKTGDLIVAADVNLGERLVPGQDLTATIAGHESLQVRIR